MIRRQFVPTGFGRGTIVHRDGKTELACFVPHSGFSRFRPRLPITDNELERFADLLGEGLTVTQAAKAMGHGYNYGNAMLQRIRARLGSQAA